MKKVLIILFAVVCTAVNAQNSYPTFYENPKESYVKAMKGVFEDIRSRKWEKAQKDLDKVCEKSTIAKLKAPEYTNTQLQALYPLPELAEAIILSTEGTMVPTIQVDYTKAYSNLKHALTFSKKDELNTFLTDPNVNINLTMLQDRIEGELCKQATKANTEQAYDAVVDSLVPTSLNLQGMKMQREDLVYSIINKKPTEAECSRFLKKYTDALPMHKMVIAHSLDSIHFYSREANIQNLESYIKTYPNSSYIKMAKDSLEALEYQNVTNTAASCSAFMKKYPESKYYMQVKKHLHEYAYKEAIAAGTSEAYINYCKEFPYELHYQQIFDSLLCRSIKDIYDTVFAGHKPDPEKVLSKAFCESVKQRDNAYQQMIEKSLVPPARRNIYTGIKEGLALPYNDLDIVEFNLLSKKNASVHILLIGPAPSAMVQEVQNTGKIINNKTVDVSSTGSVTIPQIQQNISTDIYLDYIFENDLLKLDDIRLDNGKSSQKKSSM